MPKGDEEARRLLDRVPLVDLLERVFDGAYLLDRAGRIVYWNAAAERITGFAREEVLGRACADQLLVHVDDNGVQLCQTACPAKATMDDAAPREARVYLRHKAGHRVATNVRVIPVPGSGPQPAGALELFDGAMRQTELTERVAELSRLAMVDELTQLPNRRYVEQTLGMRLEGLRRQGAPFGVLMIDIDHFKRVNDRHGHGVGDQVLETVANTLRHSARGPDLIGRWGGEEFVGVISQIDEQGLVTVAERLRGLVAQSSVAADGGERVAVTASFGGALATPHEEVAVLISRADNQLYRAKRTGRDRVCV